jgi:hypothetical protein
MSGLNHGRLFDFQVGVGSRLAQPILPFKIIDSGKFPFVVRDKRVPECDRVCGEQQIVSTDRLTNPFEAAAKLAVDGIRWRVEGEDLDGAQDGVELSG